MNILDCLCHLRDDTIDILQSCLHSLYLTDITHLDITSFYLYVNNKIHSLMHLGLNQ